jgi:two-component system, NarL family, invasion response regulator UvrY
MTSIFLVDDHNLLRNGMAELVAQFEGYSVCGQAANGKEFIEQITNGAKPDIIILDIQMPVMNGEETALWLKANQPNIKILVLTMYDDETNILRMIRAGASGYLLKDSDPQELKDALDTIRDRGTYHSDLVDDTLKKAALGGRTAYDGLRLQLTNREVELIKWLCTDLSYKEIAQKMECSPRTVDSFRDAVFSKLGVKSRMALALFAMKNGWVEI